MGIFNIFNKKSNNTEYTKEIIKSEELEKENIIENIKNEENNELTSEEINKSGWVYIISNRGSFGPNIFKIGATRRKNPEDRVKELGDASVPFKYDIQAFIQSNDAYELEAQIHRFLKGKELNKVKRKKEFYITSLVEIKDIVEKLGYRVKWNFEQPAIEFERSKNL